MNDVEFEVHYAFWQQVTWTMTCDIYICRHIIFYMCKFMFIQVKNYYACVKTIYTMILDHAGRVSMII